MPSITDAATLGQGLRATRQDLGRSLEEMSVATKVPTRFLRALEDSDFSALPSRVFAVGYVRVYAGALGLDEQLAVERFKRESPDASVPLQAPAGVAFQDRPRRSQRIVAAVAVLAVAVVGWNVFQRVNMIRAPQPSDIVAVPETWSIGQVPGQAVATLGAPRPAPPDQTIPALYITPGLEAQLAGVDPADPNAVPVPAVVGAPVQAAFNPRGAVYGASATASQVVLQARKAAAIVVRMADGRVLFARQLAAGESWRAPIGVSAVVDVSDPTAFDVYLNGEHGGGLSAVVTPLNTLNSRAQATARQTADHLAAQAAAAQAAANRAALATGQTVAAGQQGLTGAVAPR